MEKRNFKKFFGGLAAIGIIFLVSVFVAGCAKSKAPSAKSKGPSGTITISGSTMLYPLNSVWAVEYHKLHPNVTVSVAGTGSGFGISNAADGNITIGASDAYLTKAFKKRYPSLVNVPVALDDAQVIYNIPGIPNDVNLKMTPQLVADIYLGKINNWDNPIFKKLNPQYKFPNLHIFVVHRADASGTTFDFTSLLTDTSKTWANKVGRSLSPSWPVGSGYLGSDAVVAAVKSTSGAIGYVGLGWILEYHLSSAAMLNKAGNYVVGSVETIAAAANSALAQGDFPADFDKSIVWNVSAKNAYPDSNFEFWMIRKKQPNPSTTATIKDLVNWSLGPGQAAKYTVKTGFAPLPKSVMGNVKKLLAQVA
ncbi:MAG: phosphate ABC transporter substrate-binding protein PstS [Deltaproteobacteria bacterium]|nr:phosphate ABC transporter substrate-binding protein PstS [Deltaproteobacteria bacterium]